MKVNNEQIEQLYTFTRKHYVEHYDLQTELVDHMAMAIEKQWETQPYLSFEQALSLEFKKFGVFGFMEVVEERQKALGKRYMKLIGKHVIEYFKLPKIILTATLIFLLYWLLSSDIVNRPTFLITLLVLALAFLIEMIVANYRKRKRQQINNERRWLYEDIINSTGHGLGITLLPVHLFNILNTGVLNYSDMHPVLLFCLCLFVVLLGISIYIVRREIPKKAEIYLKEVYPEMELV